MNHPPMITLTNEESWEPWTPKVGDRARIRITGECELRYIKGCLHESLGNVGHPLSYDGVEGTVVGVDSAGFYAERGHRFWVRTESRVDVGDGFLTKRYDNWAAIELIPLDRSTA